MPVRFPSQPTPLALCCVHLGSKLLTHTMILRWQRGADAQCVLQGQPARFAVDPLHFIDIEFGGTLRAHAVHGWTNSIYVCCQTSARDRPRDVSQKRTRVPRQIAESLVRFCESSIHSPAQAFPHNVILGSDPGSTRAHPGSRTCPLCEPFVMRNRPGAPKTWHAQRG